MKRNIMLLWLFSALALLLISCVTAVDDALPYESLPEVTLATPVRLVASPNHPTAYLTDTAIASGAKVQLIGSDSNAAWLLVRHTGILGWMPTIFSQTNIANSPLAVTVDPVPSQCTYLDSILGLDEAWTSTVRGDVTVVGSLYRPEIGDAFEDAVLEVSVAGSGHALEGDHVHTPLTSEDGLVLFGFTLTGLVRGSTVEFELAGTGEEPVDSVVSFFGSECRKARLVNHLPVGMVKLPAPDTGQAPSANDVVKPPHEQDEATSVEPLIIRPGQGTHSENSTRAETDEIHLSEGSLPLSFSGIWEGKTDTGGSWTILLGLSSAPVGAIAGTVAYPSLRCGGELWLTDSAAHPHEYRFLQRITYGNCTDDLYVRLSPIDELTLAYREEYANGSVAGSGYVTRKSLPLGQGPTQAVNPGANSREIRQWATHARASSQYGENRWSAAQATSAPNTTRCGDIDTAWAPRSNRNEQNWLELDYATPVLATRVRVHETYNAGSIIKVELRDTDNRYHTVWTGKDTTSCPGWFEVGFTVTDYLVDGVRIYTQIDGWEEIDAVELIGHTE